MANNKSADKVPPIGQIVAITSGKGGVGKTSVAVNLGFALVQRGLRVCVVDADANLANINIMLKQTPEFTLEHVINGEKTINEIMLQKDELCVIPAATGASNLINQSVKKNKCIVDAVTSLKDAFDYVLIDTAAGISDSVLRFIQSSHQSLFVVSSEPTSLTDSYSLLKVLYKNKINKKTDIVINFAQNKQHAMNVFSRFSNAVEQYMGFKVGYLGFIFRDDYLSSSVCFQNPLLLQRPNSKTSQCFQLIAQRLYEGLSERREVVKTQQIEDVSCVTESLLSNESIEKTLSLINLENDFTRYLKTNKQSKNEIEMTLKKLTQQFYQIFETNVEASAMTQLHDFSKATDESLTSQVHEKNTIAVQDRSDHDNTFNSLQYLGYVDSILFASLVDEYSSEPEREAVC